MSLPLYLVHGWGFDASFWNPMLDHLPGVEAYVVDAGYFGAPSHPPLPQTPYLAVGHSAGSLSLLEQDLPGCEGLVLFNGFARFSAAGDYPDGVPARVLERMRRQLQKSPETVLADFRNRCGTDEPVPGPPAIERLDAGLEKLLLDDAREQAARWGDRLHWMTGQSDPFPPARLGFSSPGSIVDGGHLLPLAEPALCADSIRQWFARHG
ncbi:hypothetical protein Gbth_025_047 [Gluconobacter thailandicus F149-1 = NBRC 100600]|uniref:Biotin synthase n=1 Tax=Gluconobacter thailandicus NBRC 3257 TaxID=1381097 RepID=A0ABQ0IUV8_GLUTH|nr:alpha/beta hydrolase [Gluconobacter thailandicus]GAN91460.1 hypothetical protein Gbfr_037_055 [Gluconobacter frateurii M-2]KXV52188.1 biotin synthase [Gluconobacter thailandicus]GAC86419.1 biotin synthase [Gluconobacter thailandicus NBRC 3255]GAD25981.1 biotin synthase [Gluconobacter thailandicus NBRC 3257]GAN93582.1 hypothetical protein Gbth_025_047 [Gluconobacter thailandicus F149-1 = NBRC 100600]